MKAFDARCTVCGRTHVVWVMWEHEEGDEVGYRCLPGNFCGGYAKHTLISSLDGLSDDVAWGPPEEVGDPSDAMERKRERALSG